MAKGAWVMKWSEQRGTVCMICVCMLGWKLRWEIVQHKMKEALQCDAVVWERHISLMFFENSWRSINFLCN